MVLAEYTTEVERLEQGHYAGTAEALRVRAGLVARNLDRALWRPEHRAEAAGLAARARAAQSRFAGLPARQEV